MHTDILDPLDAVKALNPADTLKLWQNMIVPKTAVFGFVCLIINVKILNQTGSTYSIFFFFVILSKSTCT